MRPSWDEYMLDVARATASRSTCSKRQVGAVVATADHRIVSTGYNGGPRKFAHCVDGACPRSASGAATGFGYEDPELFCIAIHAEANALLQCGPQDRDGSTIFTTTAPCFSCAKLIANSGIAEVVACEGYEGYEFVRDFLMRSGVRVRGV